MSPPHTPPPRSTFNTVVGAVIVLSPVPGGGGGLFGTERNSFALDSHIVVAVFYNRAMTDDRVVAVCARAQNDINYYAVAAAVRRLCGIAVAGHDDDNDDYDDDDDALLDN